MARFYRRRKFCRFTAENVTYIDYKDVILNALCIYWFYIGVIGFKAENDQSWAKRFFLFSVILITVVSLCFSFTATAPSTQIILF